MDELRRGYHDRISLLHESTIDLLELAAAAVSQVTSRLLGGDAVLLPPSSTDKIEAEVLDLLAQQAPVARDLRVIIASLWIAQIADLCLGLCRSVAERSAPMPAALQGVTGEIGAATAHLLAGAARAWKVIDRGVAVEVEREVEPCRQLQRSFLASLLELDAMPVEHAVDLGIVARAYERLTDHAEEILSRVMFASGLAA